MKLKIKKNDLFSKNMSNRELYLLWKKLSNKPVKNKQYGKKVRKQVGRSNSTRSNNNSNNDSKMRDFKITKKEGEWYNTIVTDSYGKVYQNWYETASEASDWVMYIWEKEDWFNSVNSEELLYKAIQECKAIDKDKGIGSIL